MQVMRMPLKKHICTNQRSMQDNGSSKRGCLKMRMLAGKWIVKTVGAMPSSPESAMNGVPAAC